MESITYGISVISCLMRTYYIGSLYRAILIADAAGYSGVQFHPVRGWWRYANRMQGDFVRTRVICYENPWFKGSVLSAIRRRDFVIFPSRIADAVIFEHERFFNFPDATRISLGWTSEAKPVRALTEIHPELEVDPEVYLKRWEQKKQGYCFDILHADRPDFGDKNRSINYWDMFNTLPVESIGIWHVHPRKGEIEDLKKGKGLIIKKLEAIAQKGVHVPVIIEVAPRLTPMHMISSKELIKHLGEIRIACARVLG